MTANHSSHSPEALAGWQADIRPKSMRTIEDVMNDADVPDFARDFVSAVLEYKRAYERLKKRGRDNQDACAVDWNQPP